MSGGTQSHCIQCNSGQRATLHRCRVLEDLQLQVLEGASEGGTLREQFDRFIAQRGQKNNNNLNQTNNTGLNFDDTVFWEELNEWDGEAREQQKMIAQPEQEDIQHRFELAHVPQVGNMSSLKPGGTFQWMYCQVNGMASDRRVKLKRIMDLAEEYEVDGIALVKVGVNWGYFRLSSRLSSWVDRLSE